MNRKQFFQLLGLLPLSLLMKGNDTMFPEIAYRTNKYGDMLKEFYQGIKRGTLSETRLNDITREFNELWDRENKYKTMLSATGGPKLDQPVINNPRYLSGPLQPLELVKTTTKSTTNNTDYYVEFDTTYGKSDAFYLDPSDNTIIRVAYVGVNVGLGGRAKWASNASGYRAILGQFYNNAGVSLGSNEFSKLPPVNGDTTITPFFFGDLLSASPDIAYFRVKVIQNSGGALDLTNFQMTLFNI